MSGEHPGGSPGGPPVNYRPGDPAPGEQAAGSQPRDDLIGDHPGGPPGGPPKDQPRDDLIGDRPGDHPRGDNPHGDPCGLLPTFH